MNVIIFIKRGDLLWWPAKSVQEKSSQLFFFKHSKTLKMKYIYQYVFLLEPGLKIFKKKKSYHLKLVASENLRAIICVAHIGPVIISYMSYGSWNYTSNCTKTRHCILKSKKLLCTHNKYNNDMLTEVWALNFLASKLFLSVVTHPRAINILY